MVKNQKDNKNENKNENEVRDHCLYHLVVEGKNKYIGITNRHPSIREKEHRKDKVFDKLDVAYVGLTENEAKLLEVYFIKEYETLKEFGGYNIHPGNLKLYNKYEDKLKNGDCRLFERLELYPSKEKIEKWHNYYNKSALSGEPINGDRYKDPLMKVDGYITSAEYNQRKSMIKIFSKYPLDLNSIEQERFYKYHLKLYKKGITKGWPMEISIAVLIQLVLNENGKFIDTNYVKSVLNEDYKDSSYQKAYKDFKKGLNIKTRAILPLKAYYDFYIKILGLHDYEHEILSFLAVIEDHEILINKKRSKFVLAVIKLIYNYFCSKCNEINKYIANKSYYKVYKEIAPLIEEFFSEGGDFEKIW